MIEIGIAMPAKTIRDVASAANAAAQYPFSSFSLYGDLGDLPPYSALYAATGDLRNSAIKSIGPMGVSPQLMHQALIAPCAAELEALLPGQTYVGIVRGAFLENIGKKQSSLKDIKDCVAYVSNYCETRGLAVPICIGGFGERLLDLAGTMKVDSVKLGCSASPELAVLARKFIKNPTPKVILGAVSVIDQNRKEARHLARHEVAKYLAAIGGLDPTLNGDEKASYNDFVYQYQQGLSGAPERISDNLLDKFALAGTVDDAVVSLITMEGKVDRFEFGTPHGLESRAEAIHYIGKTILKEFL